MSARSRNYLAVLAVLAALTALMAQAGIAFGDHGDDGGVLGPGEIIYLSMGNSPSSDQITFGDLEQDIPTKKNDCTAVSGVNTKGPDQVLELTPINASTLGESKDHIGTKGPNDGSGEPCALAAAGAGLGGLDEGISVKLGSDVSDVDLSGFSIDIRLKFNSSVKATTYLEGSPVDTGIPLFSMGPSDNGPDSADNFRWTYVAEPGQVFDEVRFVAVAGAFALGGGDESDNPGEFDSSSHASQFQTAQVFDGEITCGDTHTIEDGEFPDTVGVVTVHSMEFPGSTGFEVTDCPLKLYTDEVGITRLAFVPLLENTSARYTMVVTVANQPITTDGNGNVTSLQVQYNLDGDLSFDAVMDPMQSCNGQPIDDMSVTGPTVATDYEMFWEQADPLLGTNGMGSLNAVPLLPGSEVLCFYSAGVTPTGVDGDGDPIGTETWKIYFEDDPAGFW